MLTIALCCNTAFAVANFRSGVIRALVARGHRVVVIAPHDPIYMDALEALGAECIPWAVSGRSTGLLGELAALRGLIRIYRALRPDVAFNYTIKSVIYGAIAGRCAGVSCVSVITGLGYVFLNDGWVSHTARTLYAWTLKWSREVWFLNADDEANFRRLRLIEGVRIQRLPGEGVDMQHFAAVPLPSASRAATGVTFLMIARLLRDKGVLEFVEAARRLRTACPGARFQLLGAADADNPTAISRASVDAWVADGVVEYLGVVRDVRPIIAAADCVVLPSYREGAPRSLLEAASMQRAVVATDVPGCRDVVIAQESGLLCRPRDAADLADKMQAITRLSPEKLAAMGRRGRHHVGEHFDESLVVNLYVSAVDRMTAPKGVLSAPVA